jgi:hypothetical protein
MASKTGRRLNIIISTLLLALFLYLAFRNVDLKELFNILKTTNYLYVFVGILIGALGGSLVRSYRWKFLLEPIKSDIKYKNLFSTTVVGYMMNNLIPRSGEVARPYLLGKNEGISKMAAFGTIILERIIDTVIFLLMFGFCLIFFKNRISNAFPQIGSAVVILIILTFVLFAWIIFSMFKTELSLKIVKVFTKILPNRYQVRIDSLFGSLVNSFEILKKPKLLVKIGFYTFILWFVYLVSTLIPFYSFDILTNGSIWLSMWNANLLLVLISVSMFVPAPAGTGPYHYVCKVTLTSIFSISEVNALGYATSTHLMGFILYFIGGMYYFISMNYKFSELKEETV